MCIRDSKDSFQLDTVCSLLSYINGHLDDESDDIIDDRTLYLSAADAVGKMFRQSQLSYETVDQACAHAIEGYEEPFPGAKERAVSYTHLSCRGFRGRDRTGNWRLPE